MAGILRGVLGIGSKVSSPLKMQTRGVLDPGPPRNPLTKMEVYFGIGVVFNLIVWVPPMWVLYHIKDYYKMHLRDDRK